MAKVTLELTQVDIDMIAIAFDSESFQSGRLEMSPAERRLVDKLQAALEVAHERMRQCHEHKYDPELDACSLCGNPGGDW